MNIVEQLNKLLAGKKVMKVEALTAASSISASCDAC